MFTKRELSMDEILQLNGWTPKQQYFNSATYIFSKFIDGVEYEFIHNPTNYQTLVERLVVHDEAAKEAMGYKDFRDKLYKGRCWAETLPTLLKMLF